jgi:peptidoglycan/xylan/chitin deacetylase (PgdA/CDA1 family)
MKELILKIVDYLNLYPLFNSYTRNTATVFMLHRVSSDDMDGFNRRVLRRFCNYLNENNYRVSSLSEYVASILQKKPTYKTVVLTVDDGYRDFYLNAYPVLREFNYPATVFITTGFINEQLKFWWDIIEYSFLKTDVKQIDLDCVSPDRLNVEAMDKTARYDIADKVINHCKKLENSKRLEFIDDLVLRLGIDISEMNDIRYQPLKWNEILEMKANGIEFHSHTITHPILTSLSSDQKCKEITEPREEIKKKLGSDADLFCYPNGQYKDIDEECVRYIVKAGYISAVTAVEGFNGINETDDVYYLKRFPVPSDFKRFKQYVSGLERFKRSIIPD